MFQDVDFQNICSIVPYHFHTNPNPLQKVKWQIAGLAAWSLRPTEIWRTTWCPPMEPWESSAPGVQMRKLTKEWRTWEAMWKEHIHTKWPNTLLTWSLRTMPSGLVLTLRAIVDLWKGQSGAARQRPMQECLLLSGFPELAEVPAERTTGRGDGMTWRRLSWILEYTRKP